MAVVAVLQVWEEEMVWVVSQEVYVPPPSPSEESWQDIQEEDQTMNEPCLKIPLV